VFREIWDCQEGIYNLRRIDIEMEQTHIKRKTALAGVLLCFLSLGIFGCGEENIPVKPEKTAEAEQTDREPASVTEPDAPAEQEEEAADTAEAGNAGDEPEENAEGKGQALWRAQIRHYYGGVLSQIIAARQLPDGELDTSSLDAGFGEMRDNHFAVTDIDKDGREELIVSYSNASMAGMEAIIYDYDPVTGQLKRELTEYPALTYYDNGIIKAEASHNHSMGEFWPLTFYRYQADSDTYTRIAYVNTWSKAFSQEWYEGQAFPDERDSDGDGVLYSIHEGAEASNAYSDYQYNETDYEAWYQSLMEGAEEVQIDYQPLAYEAFADFTPAYLKRLADEAGKDRTDTEADLGLLLFGKEHFLDASKKLLSEKYGVTITRPDADFEEYTVGSLDGREIFSFEHLNAGVLDYHGEKLEDVTIFGLYPGIGVDDAWEKLKAYGFYASPYGEVENCLITGEGFGNISVWFGGEEGKVTQISLHPYCAFAG